jgi:hypothetical protein
MKGYAPPFEGIAPTGGRFRLSKCDSLSASRPSRRRRCWTSRPKPSSSTGVLHQKVNALWNTGYTVLFEPAEEGGYVVTLTKKPTTASWKPLQLTWRACKKKAGR